MSNSLNPVFGEWYTDKQLGTGTDGKVFLIYKQLPGGKKETSVMKLIMLGENRKQRIISPSDEVNEENKDFDSSIKEIKRNIETVRRLDNGKCFVKYEDVEFRTSADNKSKLILVRLEEMRSLSGVLDSLSFTLEETIRLGISVCRSLVKCREFNYVYPNLKPENILFDRNGICKLGDFGSFSCVEPSKTSVAYRRTQYFTAPEIIKSGNINCTADTYSLGLILYMLTNRGRLPFMKPYPEKLSVNSFNEATEKRINGQTIKKPELCSDGLWRIISRACCYDFSKRYLSPDLMLKDLIALKDKENFFKMTSEDVYSKRNENSDKENYITPKFEYTYKDMKTTLSDIKPKEPVNLKKEIQIPTQTPVYKSPYQKPTGKKTVIEPVQIKSKKKVKYSQKDLRKLVILSLVVVLVFLLLVISLLLRKIGEDSGTVSGLVMNSVFDFIDYNLLI